MLISKTQNSKTKALSEKVLIVKQNTGYQKIDAGKRCSNFSNCPIFSCKTILLQFVKEMPEAMLVDVEMSSVLVATPQRKTTKLKDIFKLPIVVWRLWTDL